jgi:hypothetical protein
LAAKEDAVGDDYLTRAVLGALDDDADTAAEIAHRMRRQGFVDCSSSTVDGVLQRLERTQRVRRAEEQPSRWLLVPDGPAPTGSPRPRSDAESFEDLVARGKELNAWLDRTLLESQRAATALAAARVKADFVRPEERLRHTLLGELPKLTVTPAGKRRAVSVQIDAKGTDGNLRARLEVIDGTGATLWFCIRVGTHEDWVALRDGGESTTSWSLPLRPAPQRSDYPAPLIWRCREIEEIASAAERVSKALHLDKFDTVELTVIPPPRPASDGATGDAATAQRLIRRRGLIPRGRKYPVRGYCDHCGQPLSDPYSLLVGVGPVCRQYYSPAVLRAVASASGALSDGTVATRTPADAVAQLAAIWA